MRSTHFEVTEVLVALESPRGMRDSVMGARAALADAVEAGFVDSPQLAGMVTEYVAEHGLAAAELTHAPKDTVIWYLTSAGRERLAGMRRLFAPVGADVDEEGVPRW